MSKKLLDNLESTIKILKYMFFGGLGLIWVVFIPMYDLDRLAIIEIHIIFLIIILMFVTITFINILQVFKEYFNCRDNEDKKNITT